MGQTLLKIHHGVEKKLSTENKQYNYKNIYLISYFKSLSTKVCLKQINYGINLLAKQVIVINLNYGEWNKFSIVSTNGINF